MKAQEFYIGISLLIFFRTQEINSNKIIKQCSTSQESHFKENTNVCFVVGPSSD